MCHNNDDIVASSNPARLTMVGASTVGVGTSWSGVMVSLRVSSAAWHDDEMSCNWSDKRQESWFYAIQNCYQQHHAESGPTG